MRGLAPSRPRALAAAACAAAFVVGGCAALRPAAVGERERAAFVAALPRPAFPFEASYSGVAEVGGREVPFLAGIRAGGPSDETVGIFDPLGRPLLYLVNSGGILTVRRGEAAGFARELGLPVPAEGVAGVGPLSLASVLFGAPGYPASGGRIQKSRSGGLTFSDGRQELFFGPPGERIARASYRVAGRRYTVTYAGHDAAGPARSVAVEGRGWRVVLRRDEE